MLKKLGGELVNRISSLRNQKISYSDEKFVDMTLSATEPEKELSPLGFDFVSDAALTEEGKKRLKAFRDQLIPKKRIKSKVTREALIECRQKIKSGKFNRKELIFNGNFPYSIYEYINADGSLTKRGRNAFMKRRNNITKKDVLSLRADILSGEETLGSFSKKHGSSVMAFLYYISTNGVLKERGLALINGKKYQKKKDSA